MYTHHQHTTSSSWRIYLSLSIYIYIHVYVYKINDLIDSIYVYVTLQNILSITSKLSDTTEPHQSEVEDDFDS